MKALFFDGAQFSLRDMPTPVPPAGESLIRVKAAGICPTDIEIGRGYMQFTGVPGHEFVGVVEQSETQKLVGKRVVGEINCACGTCDFCLRGLGRHCPKRTVLGICDRDGCFAEYTCLPDENLHVLPDDMTDFQGVMVEPTAAAFRIVEQLGELADKRIAVLGDGRLGLLAAQALASEGASVCVIGRHPERKAILSTYDIEFRKAVPSDVSDLEASFPMVVECTGSPDGPADALRLLLPMGTLVLKTTVRDHLKLPSEHLVVDEIMLLGSRCGPFPRAIEALHERQVNVDRMIEENFPLSQAVDALRHASRPGALKTLIAN